MRHPRATALFCALAVVLSALGALCGAVVRTATDEAFYLDDSRRAVAVYLGREVGAALTDADEAAVARYVGLTREEQAPVARGIAAGMRDGVSDFSAVAPLNERERQHLCDVQRLIALAEQAAKLSVLFSALLAVAAAWTGAGLARRFRAALFGALAGFGALALGAVALLVALRLAGFAPLFAGMHRLLFTNDLWLLNPETDILIRMMPLPLFEQALLRVLSGAPAALAAALAMLAALYALVGGMIRRHLTEGKA